MGDSTDIDLETWDTVFRINVKSMVMMARYAIPEMRKAGRGAIVNVSSISGCKYASDLIGTPMAAFHLKVSMHSLCRRWSPALPNNQGRYYSDD